MLILTRRTGESIMIDDDIKKKIRVIQAKMIIKSHASISFSTALDLVVKEGLKKFRTKY